jgi:hypothetical protein
MAQLYPLFDASYDLERYGEGILTHLHMVHTEIGVPMAMKTSSLLLVDADV